MKRNLKIICLILTAYFYTATLKAQVFSDSVGVMISPGTDKAKTISDLKAALKGNSDVHYVGYCSNHNVYLLYVNKAVYPTRDSFFAVLESSSGISTLLLKTGDVEKTKDFCSFSDPVEAAHYKAQRAH